MATNARKPDASQNANASKTDERRFNPTAWGAFRGDRASVSVFHGRGYLHVARKDKAGKAAGTVSIALTGTGLDRLSRICKEAAGVVLSLEDAARPPEPEADEDLRTTFEAMAGL